MFVAGAAAGREAPGRGASATSTHLAEQRVPDDLQSLDLNFRFCGVGNEAARLVERFDAVKFGIFQ